MLRIEFLLVWICYFILISKSIFVFDNKYNLDARLKVQLTLNFFFFSFIEIYFVYCDHHCDKITFVAIFVNFL